MQMAELLVSHGASLSARTSLDEMPIGELELCLLISPVALIFLITEESVRHLQTAQENHEPFSLLASCSFGVAFSKAWRSYFFQVT